MRPLLLATISLSLACASAAPTRHGSAAAEAEGARLRMELFVSDTGRAVDFYTNVLGFEVERRSPDYVSIRRGSVVFGIGPISKLGTSGYFTPELLAARRGLGVEIVIEVDDVDAARARVAHHGYQLVRDMKKQPWGLRDFRLADPDGYYLRISSKS
jgi:predicted enzyme related to lactoylglutathione lyase